MKIGSTSWVSKNNYLENCKLLEGRVDFAELLIYMWDRNLEKEFCSQIDGLGKLELFYTVHLPLGNISECEKAYKFLRTTDLDIRNYVLHPHDGWQGFIEGKKDVVLENTIEAYPAYERMVIDIGHLKLSGSEDAVLNDTAVKEIREMHIHGVGEGKDHRTLDRQTIEYVSGLVEKYEILERAMKKEDFLLNFEVFDYEKLMRSLWRFKQSGYSKNLAR
ncbi:MAG: hypothetical protein JW803_02320 [Endomicrobiales bacterium]|nr:hypothetical protein [Endomicrobiales bacterium]